MSRSTYDWVDGSCSVNAFSGKECKNCLRIRERSASLASKIWLGFLEGPSLTSLGIDSHTIDLGSSGSHRERQTQW